MKSETIQQLNDLNHSFYSHFAEPFAETRLRLQPGISRLLREFPIAGNCLDIGCGSGTLALTLCQENPPTAAENSYLGLDYSPALLNTARAKTGDRNACGWSIRFDSADLMQEDWIDICGGIRFHFIFSFAVLHHIPGAAERQRVLGQLFDLLLPGGTLFTSVWRFDHSPRWLARRLDWDSIGFPTSDLEEGDTLLDWRRPQRDMPEAVGFRYVHLFGEGELENMLHQAGFSVRQTFESDGKEGNLGLYVVGEKSV